MTDETRYHVYGSSPQLAPEEIATWPNGTTVHRAVYNGNAAAILSTDDIQYMEAMLERIAENSEEGVLDEEIDGLWGLIKSGRQRMQKLHEALGAFTADSVANMRKSGSDRIDWSQSE